jgi:hypothetical protein
MLQGWTSTDDRAHADVDWLVLQHAPSLGYPAAKFSAAI